MGGGPWHHDATFGGTSDELSADSPASLRSLPIPPLRDSIPPANPQSPSPRHRNCGLRLGTPSTHWLWLPRVTTPLRPSHCSAKCAPPRRHTTFQELRHDSEVWCAPFALVGALGPRSRGQGRLIRIKSQHPVATVFSEGLPVSTRFFAPLRVRVNLAAHGPVHPASVWPVAHLLGRERVTNKALRHNRYTWSPRGCSSTDTGSGTQQFASLRPSINRLCSAPRPKRL